MVLCRQGVILILSDFRKHWRWVICQACRGIFDLDSVGEPIGASETDGFHVANGIAYNSKTGTFFLTGNSVSDYGSVRGHCHGRGLRLRPEAAAQPRPEAAALGRGLKPRPKAAA